MTTKLTKRTLALALTLALLAGLLPTVALAEDVNPGPAYSANLTEVDFGSAPVGYEVGDEDGKVRPKTVTVTKTGEQGPTTLSVSLIGSGTEYFTVSPDEISVSQGNLSQYDQITIQPNTGLGANTTPYTTTLLIKDKENADDPGITIPVTFTVTAATGFTAVTNIKGVPSTMTAGTPLTLSGTVEPDDATNKTIVWSLVSADTTAAGASVSEGKVTATGTGVVKVKATVANGTNNGQSDYTEEFTITVTPAPSTPIYVTDIANVPTTMKEGNSLTLSGTVVPANATDQTIVWSLEGAGNTGASLVGNVLTVPSHGTVTVKATIENGKETGAYTKTFSITVFEVADVNAPAAAATAAPTPPSTPPTSRSPSKKSWRTKKPTR